MGDTPIAFMCSKRRRERWRYVNMRTGERLPQAPREPEHPVVRTGRTRPNSSSRRGLRTLGEAHEYRCTYCGHVGWSVHRGVLSTPLEGDDDG